MAQIKASDVGKLRKMTGAGMMDCKKALSEANGDFDEAVKIIRERGQLVANKRSDREASEGCVLSATSADKKVGAIVALNCETDFVAKNEDFVKLTKNILDVAIANNAASLDELKEMEIEGRKIADIITSQTGIVGEKIELSYFEKVSAEDVTAYIHPGNRIATIVALNKSLDAQVGKDIAMQVAAMNPVSLNKDDVAPEVVERELEIGREQARAEGKPEAMLDKIAQGKLGKFFKENTLLSQAFIKDNKVSVQQYVASQDKDATVVAFKRFGLAD